MRQNFIERISETMESLSARKGHDAHLAKHATQSSTMRRIFICQVKIIANATAFLLNIEWILHLTFVHGLPMSSRSAMIFLKKTNKLSDSIHITWGKLKLLVLFIFSIINVLQVLTTNLLHSISSINSR